MSAAFSGYMQQEPPVVIAMKAYRETRVSQPSLWNKSLLVGFKKPSLEMEPPVLASFLPIMQPTYVHQWQ